MKKEIRFRLVKHLIFLEKELNDYESFKSLTWDEYNLNRSKQRDVERWIENIINSSVDIAKIILTSEGITMPDTYKDIAASLLLVKDFSKKDVEDISKRVRLRNIISHEYLDIRWSSIKKFIVETESLYKNFLDATKKYLEKKIQEGNEE